MDSADESTLLEVSNLMVTFPGKNRRDPAVKAVDGVSFKVERGSTTGLVGESGSGKTTVGRALVKLAPVKSGSIWYGGDEISSMGRKAFFPYRKKIQMIFQDPYHSLNPRLTVFGIIAEAFRIHFPDWNMERQRGRAAELLQKVGLEPEHADRFPHEFSGGQRQRIGIARALAVEPEFIICDEPVSALDVSVQAQIVNLLQDLQEEFGLTYLFIAHDLAVVEHISDYVLVMNRGRIVEQATADEIYAHPGHEYTRKLLEAVPKIQGAGHPE